MYDSNRPDPTAEVKFIVMMRQLTNFLGVCMTGSPAQYMAGASVWFTSGDELPDEPLQTCATCDPMYW